jgi:chaperonin GroES
MLRPLFDNIIVRPISKEEKKSAIILAETKKEEPETGEVIAVGPGRMIASGTKGERQPMSVKVGDKVLFNKFGVDEVEIKDGEKFLTLKETDIIAIIEPDELPQLP